MTTDSPKGHLPATEAEMKAYIETMMLLAIADGTVKDAELHVIQMAVVSYLESHAALGNMTRKDLIDECFARAQQIYDDGVHKRLSAIAQVLTTHEKRMYALGMAVAVSASDGVIHITERDALRMIQAAFGLSDDEVHKAVEAFR